MILKKRLHVIRTLEHFRHVFVFFSIIQYAKTIIKLIVDEQRKNIHLHASCPEVCSYTINNLIFAEWHYTKFLNFEVSILNKITNFVSLFGGNCFEWDAWNNLLTLWVSHCLFSSFVQVVYYAAYCLVSASHQCSNEILAWSMKSYENSSWAKW